MKLTDREKAAFVIGMDRAFKEARYPKYRTKEQRVRWVQRAVWAHQMLDGGCFNPLHAWEVRELAERIINEVTP